MIRDAVKFRNTVVSPKNPCYSASNSFINQKYSIFLLYFCSLSDSGIKLSMHLLLRGLTLLLLLSAFCISNFSSSRKEFDKCEEEEGSIPLKDRMDLAIAHELEITKDPALGITPRERLLSAIKYTVKLQNNPIQSGTHAAISGISWTERGPSNVGGRTRAILVNPNDPSKKSIFAGGAGGGLWKTADITAASPLWTPVNDLFADLAVTAIAADPLNAQIIYFGTGEGFSNGDAIRGLGMWKSVDGGNTFAQLASTNNSNFYYVQRIVVHPSTSHVFAATRTGLYKSKDSGVTWTKVLGNGTGASTDLIADVEISSDGAVWVAAGLSGTDGVYRAPVSGLTTGDAGTYSKRNTGANGFPTTGFNRIELACAPSSASTAYALVISNSTSDLINIYKTTDAGVNWSSIPLPVDADGGVSPGITRGQGWYDLAAAVDPSAPNTLMIGGVDLFKTTNSGTSWQQMSHWYGGFGFQDVHADQHFILYEPGNSSVAYFGNDGGIWRSSNANSATPTITSKNNSYNVTQFYACAAHPTAYSNYFLAGAQDNGSQQFSITGVNSTVEVTGGDGCFCHIDQDQPQYQFTSYVYNNYYRSSNSGSTWTSVNFGNSGSFVNPTDYDNVSNVMYGGESGGSYMRWTNPQTGNTNAAVAITAFNSSSVRHVSVSQNTPNRVFFGLSSGRVVRVDNANTIASGSAGTLVGTPASGSVSCIAIETGNDDHLLVTYSNYGVTSVWETTNALAATPVFTQVEGNLPDMPVRWALFNPNNNQQAMIATETGVWTTDLLNGSSTNWGPSNTGLANTRVDMLQLRESDKVVVAATHGRGLFTTDAFVTVPYPDFTATPKIVYTNKAVQFTDGSLKANSWAWDFGDGQTSTVKNPVHSYASPGLYTVTLVINANGAYTRIKTNLIQVLPDRGTPYTVAGGAAGSFDFNAIEYGADLITGTAFQRGNSAIAGKNGTVSGSSAWVTGLTNTNYSDNSEAYLYCPNYTLAAAGVYTLSFYGKWAFEQDYDGFNLQYSLDKGTTWSTLGSATATWYNFANATGGTAFSTGVPFFTGTRSAYTQYSLNISFLAGNSNVAFRFIFKSDGSVVAAGLALDNFEINGSVNSPLPVTLLNFAGKVEEKYNLLSWTTESEINNAGFYVERSEDGISFSEIGFENGYGNSSEIHDYSFRDHERKGSKINYYRLRQVDYDGAFSYSEIIALNSKHIGVLSIGPNPCRDNLSILFDKGFSDDVAITFYSIEGKVVSRQLIDSGSEKIVLNTSAFPAGIYLLKIENASGVLYTDKFLHY
jgi:PKD repeat protein